MPDEVIERMAARPARGQKEEGIRIALEIVEAVREIPGISGIHLMTISHEEAILRVVEGAGLLPRPTPSDVTIAYGRPAPPTVRDSLATFRRVGEREGTACRMEA